MFPDDIYNLGHPNYQIENSISELNLDKLTLTEIDYLFDCLESFRDNIAVVLKNHEFISNARKNYCSEKNNDNDYGDEYRKAKIIVDNAHLVEEWDKTKVELQTDREKKLAELQDLFLRVKEVNADLKKDNPRLAPIDKLKAFDNARALATYALPKLPRYQYNIDLDDSTYLVSKNYFNNYYGTEPGVNKVFEDIFPHISPYKENLEKKENINPPIEVEDDKSSPAVPLVPVKYRATELNQILETLKKSNYILNGGGKTIDGKKYPTTAFNVINAITSFLKENKSKEQTDEFIKRIHKNLDANKNPTRGYLCGFFTLGTRSIETAQVYNVCANQLSTIVPR